MGHPKALLCRRATIAGGVALALCAFGPLDVRQADGQEAAAVTPTARVPKPAEAPRVISATGYVLGLDQPGFVEQPPEVAYQINKARLVSSSPNPAARPFAALWRDDFDHARAVDCLTAAVYYEAATEGEDGQRAVAQVVLNRVRHPAFAKTVCAVVFEGSERNTGCQFTFTCDGSLARRPEPVLWERARKVAAAALNGAVYKPVGYSTHYHTVWVAPYWAPSLVKVANVGLHIFYRWEGGWGTPGAFNARYAAAETQTDVRRLAAVAPVALFQKATFIQARIEPTTESKDAEPAVVPAVTAHAQPLDIQAVQTVALQSLPTMAAAPQLNAIQMPSTALSRAPAFSLLAAPPGW